MQLYILTYQLENYSSAVYLSNKQHLVLKT